MTRISAEQAREEAIGSLADLRRELGKDVPAALAYPGGACDEATAEMLRAAGFQAAFSTRRGVNRVPPADPWRLRRINVGRRSTLPILRAQLAPSAVWANPFLR
jgi:hypothetical protein